jgi:hypothetical protein
MLSNTYMRNLIRRIEKLERVVATSAFSYGDWYVEQQQLAEAAALSRLSAADRAALTELFESRRSPSYFSDEQQALWSRWKEAFAGIGSEVPISKTFCVYDRWC